MIEISEGPAVGQEIVTGPFRVLRQIKEGDRVIVDNEAEKRGKMPAGKAAGESAGRRPA
jgi:hypothetical protein